MYSINKYFVEKVCVRVYLTIFISDYGTITVVRSVLQYSHSGTAVGTGRAKFCNIVIFTSAPHGFIAADFLCIRILYLELLT